MKNSVPFTVITLLLTGSSLPAATHFVSLGSTNPTPPYTSWVTAATNIQPAVDVAVAGDEVVVSDGIYATDRALSYSLADRVAVTKPLTVRSVNGPQATIIVGYQDQAGFYPMTRCVYLTNGASLSPAIAFMCCAFTQRNLASSNCAALRPKWSRLNH